MNSFCLFQTKKFYCRRRIDVTRELIQILKLARFFLAIKDGMPQIFQQKIYISVIFSCGKNSLSSFNKSGLAPIE